MLLLVGLFETYGAGWVFGIEHQVESVGPAIVFTYMFTNFGSIILASGLWFGLDKNAVWGGFVGLFASYLFGMAITWHLLKRSMAQDPEWTWSSILYELCLKNVMDLRADLEKHVGYMPWIWAFAIKQVIPHILLILIINLARSNNAAGESLFGHFGEFEMWPFQILGILTVVFSGFLILVGVAMPSAFEGADLTTIERAPVKEVEAEAPVEDVEETGEDHYEEEHYEEDDIAVNKLESD